MWSSRIIFAGPNKVFTQANNKQLRDSNHAVYAFDTREKVIENNDNLHKKEIRFDSIGKIKTSLYSSAIEDEILQEMGFEPEFNLENLVDKPGFLANFLFDNNRVHFCSVHKAVVPITRMRVLLDQDDIGDTVSFRYPECSKCLTCKKSQRSTAVSLQEAQEQVILEQSVMIYEESNTVIAKYPFLKDPVEFLTARHNNSNNKDQALKVYRGQCRKSEKQRQGLRLVHQELVEKDFMKKLSDCDKDIQNFIKDACFQHYNPWRTVLKEDSISTQVQRVVDPTMTSFNLLLAKGENHLGYIFDIIVRNRCRQSAHPQLFGPQH